jgi:small-conductance mechanosensitive channel
MSTRWIIDSSALKQLLARRYGLADFRRIQKNGHRPFFCSVPRMHYFLAAFMAAGAFLAGAAAGLAAAAFLAGAVAGLAAAFLAGATASGLVAAVLTALFAGFASDMSDSSMNEGFGRKALCLKHFHAIKRRAAIVEQKKPRFASARRGFG